MWIFYLCPGGSFCRASSHSYLFSAIIFSMLFTGKGDNGTTGLFSTQGGPASGWGCDQRISKSSAVAEALGALDETNSFLGLVKVKAEGSGIEILGNKAENIVHLVQENLFIIQAEIAGADKHIESQKVIEIEEIINAIEKELPPIKTFFISGGTELASLFDISRTFARRADRRVVGVHDEKKSNVGEFTLAYLNRLSSLLYALARISNHSKGVEEKAPDYR